LQIAAFVSVAFVVALVLIFFVSHGLAVPIRDLVRGTQAIRAGKFDVKVPVRSHDEVGELAASFNEMAVGLAQREQLRNALNLVADREVAEQLISGRIELGGEVRPVSVMFCDIRGFTALTQNMNPADVVLLLNEHMTALTKIVYEHGGVVDKFMGDAIMAVFGAPKSRGDDALNAARAALKMIEAREQLNENATPRIHVGIGIASGPVLAGNMGSENRLNYTVTGERVNLASRLCSQAGRSEVVIDQTTREQLGERIEAEPLPELRLKGFNDAVLAYRLQTVRG
jgi:class 3 adenylate cyclase